MAAMNISKIGSFRKNIGGAFQSGGAGAAPSSGTSGPAPPSSSLVASPSPTPSGSGPAPARVPLPSAGSAGTSLPSPSPAPSTAPGQIGGAKKKSLVLAPPKKQTRKSKVHLAPPASKEKDKKPLNNLKTTRKIRVHLGGMKKRLCRAKTIKQDSRKKPITEIRRTLEEAKLVKPCATGKEVPEDVLRTIFHDYMLLRNRVL
jgi:hypothetical protein